MNSRLFYFLLFFSLQSLQAQEPKPEDFFPSAVGNYWEYSTVYGDRFRSFVKDSIGEDGSKYIFLAENVDPWYKIDTSLCVHEVPFHPFFSEKIYNLKADSNDTWMVRPEINNFPRTEAKVIVIYDSYIFGEVRKVKEIGYWDLEFGDTVINQFAWPIGTQLLVEGIGEYQYWSAESGPIKTLRGCIIDGDTLGNVTTNIFEEHLPKISFELHQNYPNPFNPTTIIEFNLPKDEVINLTIYDMLGQKVAILHNGYLKAGDHKLKWDAEGTSSGFYIGRLQTGEWTKSIKMQLVK